VVGIVAEDLSEIETQAGGYDGEDDWECVYPIISVWKVFYHSLDSQV
jgi:hypothetical protein